MVSQRQRCPGGLQECAQPRCTPAAAAATCALLWGRLACRVAGTESGGRGRTANVSAGECVRACARVPVCARWGRWWRPLRPGSAPAGEGLQGLAPPELGICRRSLSIFVES